MVKRLYLTVRKDEKKSFPYRYKFNGFDYGEGSFGPPEFLMTII